MGADTILELTNVDRLGGLQGDSRAAHERLSLQRGSQLTGGGHQTAATQPDAPPGAAYMRHISHVCPPEGSG